MVSTSLPWLQHLLPPRVRVSQRERFRAGAGALIGILLTGLLSAWTVASPVAALWLIAPMGASAVLLFGVPSSPLAQPWSVVGGNTVAAVIGVICFKLIGSPVLAASAAIFFSIGAMFALRCLHPPSGAVALTAVLGGPEIHATGFGYVLMPVGLNTLLLLLFAVLYNNGTGRRYPHGEHAVPVHPHRTGDEPPLERVGFQRDDLEAALAEFDQILDIGVDDLEMLLHRTEAHALRRRFGETSCAAIMSREVVSVAFATDLSEAWDLMQAHAVHALPVLDRGQHVIGIVTRADFLRHADLRDQRSIGMRLRTLLQHVPLTHSEKPEVVGQIMSAPALTALDTSPAVSLVALMDDLGHHHIPIVDADRRLVGMVTRGDLVAALYGIAMASTEPLPVGASA